MVFLACWVGGVGGYLKKFKELGGEREREGFAILHDVQRMFLFYFGLAFAYQWNGRDDFFCLLVGK